MLDHMLLEHLVQAIVETQKLDGGHARAQTKSTWVKPSESILTAQFSQ